MPIVTTSKMGHVHSIANFYSFIVSIEIINKINYYRNIRKHNGRKYKRHKSYFTIETSNN